MKNLNNFLFKLPRQNLSQFFKYLQKLYYYEEKNNNNILLFRTNQEKNGFT